MTHELHALVEATLADEHDADEAWERLSAAVAAQPDAPELRRLRIRLGEAFGLRAEQLEDLQALCRLQPEDRDAALQLALRQHRWSRWLVEEPEDEDDEAAWAQAQQAEEALQAGALAQLQALAARHRGDADFQLRLLEAWGSDLPWAPPWPRLTLSLQATAAHPQDGRLRRQLLQAWLALFSQGPDFEVPEGQGVTGFAVGVGGGWYDPLIGTRAQALLDAELSAQPDDAELLSQRAQLHEALSRFALAAADHAAAAQAWAARAAEDEAAADNARQAEERAARCAQGRAALAEDMLGGIDEALQGLTGAAGPESANEAVAAFQREMQQRMQQVRQELGTEMEKLRPAMSAEAEAPDEADWAQMRELAGQVASRMGGLLPFVPMELLPRDAATLGPALDPRQSALGELARPLGFERLGLVETPAYTERFGHLTLTGIWQTPVGDACLLHSTAGPLEVMELETEFSDGRQLITTRSRGRNFYGGGPQVDTLHVDGSLPLDDLVALHRARVAWALAQQPGLRLQPWRDVDDYIAAQERQRQAKLAYRLEVGMDQAEALSVPVQQPEHFVPLLREAALDFVRRAQADWRAAGGR